MTQRQVMIDVPDGMMISDIKVSYKPKPETRILRNKIAVDVKKRPRSHCNFCGKFTKTGVDACDSCQIEIEDICLD